MQISNSRHYFLTLMTENQAAGLKVEYEKNLPTINYIFTINHKQRSESQLFVEKYSLCLFVVTEVQ